ncbi:Tctex1 domain-containing protein 3 [Clydaea vesicula]|uniref:Tctex1 domain-containing protein 3 n=1 Tax=Clydaea vesicula TaxID=447962 RepID=A0AAD5XUE7_9FUNG|nr:Tctex1 domain-containing protein 3 [Clydaea vesicula]
MNTVAEELNDSQNKTSEATNQEKPTEVLPSKPDTPPQQQQSSTVAQQSAPTSEEVQKPTSQQSNLGSKSNAASRANLHGSKSDLANSKPKATSKPNLSNKPQPTENQQSEAPANAIIYENTYRMKPDKKFSSEAVIRVLEGILQTKLQKVKYDAEKTGELSKNLANEILSAVKKFEFDRYKYVVDVNIGEFKGQGIKVASRCVWDTTTDSYASSSFRNSTFRLKHIM